jgi:NAD(P)-dependent dehydrogenase (short-subunit alcohol dehydrogenase family)
MTVPATSPAIAPDVHRLPEPTTSLRGRGVVVSGGNRGIGLGLAQGCLLAGATVVIWGRDETANDAALQTLSATPTVDGAAPAAFAVRCDVADEAAVVAAFARSVELAGPVHAVFANAGVSCDFGPFHTQTDEVWDQVFGVNIAGLRWTLREGVRHMLEHGEGGSLIGTASMAARFGMRGYAPYATSKGAVVTLMQTLAVEYARKGIRANALLPGFISTDMTTGGSEKFYSQIVERTPARRFGVPADFARLAAFLADPANSFHTADSVLVDGGYMNV